MIMTLREVLLVANDAYPDELIDVVCEPSPVEFEEDHYDVVDGMGDTLAIFIARELQEVFDPEASDEDNLLTAARAMANASQQLLAVERALHVERVRRIRADR